MSAGTAELVKMAKCSRCHGSGMHTHGVCYGCEGLGIAKMTDYLIFKKNVDAAVRELANVEQIIAAMLDAMTVEQKNQVAARLEAAGLAGEGMARHHERRAALAAFEK